MRGQQLLEIHLQLLFGAIPKYSGIALLRARFILHLVRESKGQIAGPPLF
jgi:hypothetical protein